MKGNMSTSSRNFIRLVVLVLLLLQNAGYSLLRKYSTMTEDVSSKEILLLGEVIKLVISIWFVMYDDSPTSAQGQGVEKLIWLLRHSYKMLVLAGIYAAMNILSFVAFAGIGAGEFTVCAQLKVLTTAGFSVIVLGTNLSGAKWRALGLLVLGCILVASPSLSNHNGQDKGLSLV